VAFQRIFIDSYYISCINFIYCNCIIFVYFRERYEIILESGIWNLWNALSETAEVIEIIVLLILVLIPLMKNMTYLYYKWIFLSSLLSSLFSSRMSHLISLTLVYHWQCARLVNRSLISSHYVNIWLDMSRVENKSVKRYNHLFYY